MRLTRLKRNNNKFTSIFHDSVYKENTTYLAQLAGLRGLEMLSAYFVQPHSTPCFVVLSEGHRKMRQPFSRLDGAPQGATRRHC